MTNDEEAMQHISAMARKVPAADEAFAQWVAQDPEHIRSFLLMSAALAEFLISNDFFGDRRLKAAQ